MPRVSAAARLPRRPRWPGRTISNPYESGRGILLIAGSDGGLSGACLAQQGWCLPQGILAGAIVTKTEAAIRERKLGQQEWSCPLEECETGFCAVESSDCSTDARATGILQQQSTASTTAAINFLNIAIRSRLTWAGLGHL